jgi:hypothetical protein
MMPMMALNTTAGNNNMQQQSIPEMCELDLGRCVDRLAGWRPEDVPRFTFLLFIFFVISYQQWNKKKCYDRTT